MHRFVVAIAALSAYLGCTGVSAAIQPGQAAPDFVLTGTDGKPRNSPTTKASTWCSNGSIRAALM